MFSDQPMPQPLALVVDDNQDLADNVAELLGELSIECVTAYGPEEAKRCLDSHGRHCDLAIVDILMPGQTGVDLMIDIKRQCPDAEVILLTANASLDTAMRAVHEGAFAYVEKPFDPQQLLMLGERALAQALLRKERGRLQSKLSRSEALYRTVVDGVDALILSVAPDGRLQMANRTAQALLGYELQALAQRRLSDLAAGPAAQATFAAAIEGARQGATQQDLEVPVLRADGQERVVRWRLAPMQPPWELTDCTSEAEGAFVLAVGEDMTDRAELERRAVEAEAMAAIATLTAGLAHEIRNPLNAATLQLQLIARQIAKITETDLQHGIQRRVTIVQDEVVRLSSLLDDFLRLAKPQRLSLRPVAVSSLFQEVCALQEPAAAEANVRLRTDLADPELRAMGDHDTLVQVLVNLTINAFDALRGRGGSVTLRAMAQGASRLAIEVADDGPGIPPDVAKDLFRPFVTSKEAGTGLGLTIVERIIDRHGGTITAGAAPGGGALLRISLQRAVSPVPTP